MLFGEIDWLADFEFQKELLKKISTIQSVHLLPRYDHLNFYGMELDDSVQVLVS